MKNYGTNTDAKSLATMGDLADSKSEANHTWGGRAIINDVSPIDAACLLEMSANRLLGFPPANVNAHYTTNSSVWYQRTTFVNSQKADLFSAQSIITMGNTDTPTANAGARVTLSFAEKGTQKSVLYCEAKKLLVKIYTGGIPETRLKVEWRAVTDVDAGISYWQEIFDGTVSGQPGWVSIPLNLTVGWHADNSNAYKYSHNCGELRLTMYSTSTDKTTQYITAGIGSVRLIAPTLYYSSYDLSANNMPFKIDGDGIPVFGSAIKLHNGDHYVTIRVASDGTLKVSDANGERVV